MTDPGELAVLAALAGAWWIPTFLCLHDLQNREGVRRVLVWKWAAILCVPVLGAALYAGKVQLAEALEAAYENE